MFPDEEEIITEENENLEPGQGKSLGFNFETNELEMVDGRLVLYEGLAAIKFWIEKQIHTEKDRFVVYQGEEYGITSLKDLITSDFPELFIKAQIEEEITERLLEHRDIKEVSEFEFTKEKRTWYVAFTVYTTYGTVEEAVVI